MLTLQCDVQVSKSLQWLRGRGELCDVLIVGGDGQHAPAHSCVLAAHSTVAAALLQGRLAAQKEWSVLRPLVIAVGGQKDIVAGDGPPYNIMDTLITLLYGESISIPDSLLSPLLSHAQLLGLSQLVCGCLEGVGGTGGVQPGDATNGQDHVKQGLVVLRNGTSSGSVVGGSGVVQAVGGGRRKHSRKPSLKTLRISETNDSETKDASEVPDSSCVTPSDNVFPDDEGGGGPEGGLIEFSMLCEGGEGETSPLEPPQWHISENVFAGETAKEFELPQTHTDILPQTHTDAHELLDAYTDSGHTETHTEAVGTHEVTHTYPDTHTEGVGTHEVTHTYTDTHTEGVSTHEVAHTYTDTHTDTQDRVISLLGEEEEDEEEEEEVVAVIEEEEEDKIYYQRKEIEMEGEEGEGGMRREIAMEIGEMKEGQGRRDIEEGKGEIRENIDIEREEETRRDNSLKMNEEKENEEQDKRQNKHRKRQKTAKREDKLDLPKRPEEPGQGAAQGRSGRGGGKGLCCRVCGATFQRACDLVKHIQHSQHFSQQCPLCYVQVREVEGQRLHFALHDQELPFFCVYCDLRFRTRAALTMHAPKHSNTKPFVCGDCGRGFKWRHALQAHSYTHSPTDRLLCDVCGFSSKYVSSFKAHLLRHAGHAFPCPHPGCTFTSSRKTHLKDHYATHSKTRVHQCEVCGHSFSHAKNMRRHMRLHQPSTHLTCSSASLLHCSFMTTRLDKLRDHMAKKHGITMGGDAGGGNGGGGGGSVSRKNSSSSSSRKSKKCSSIGVTTTTTTTTTATATAIFNPPTTTTTTTAPLPPLLITLPPSESEQTPNKNIGADYGMEIGDDIGKGEIGGGEATQTDADNFPVLVVELADIQTLDAHMNPTDMDAHMNPTDMDAHMDADIDTHIHTPTDIHTPIHTDAHTLGIMDAHTDTHTHTYMPTDTHTELDAHTHKEVGKHSSSSSSSFPPLPQITFSSYGTEESVVLEVMEEEEEGKEEGEKKKAEEECIDSLNILDFMLDNVEN